MILDDTEDSENNEPDLEVFQDNALCMFGFNLYCLFNLTIIFRFARFTHRS